MDKTQKKALLEAFRELLRTVVLATIPVLVDSLNRGSVDYRTILVVAAISALRFIEKYLYESGSDNVVTETLRFENVK